MIGKDTRRTAVVTGASSGLGRELARGLARRGYDLLLVARREERLDALHLELELRHPVRASVLALDLSEPSHVTKLVAEMEARSESLEVLAHAAGFGIFGPFVESEAEAEERMLRLHIDATVRLNRVAARVFAAKNKGFILNVASTAGFKPGPRALTYSASKAFVVSFGAGLADELRASGVHVTTLCPGPTRTEFDSVAHGLAVAPAPSYRSMDAARVAEAGLAALFSGKAVLVPGAANRLHVLATRIMPRRLLGALTRRVRSRRESRAARADGDDPDDRPPLRPVPFGGLTLYTGDFETTAAWLIEQATRPAPVPRVVAHINANNLHRALHGAGGEGSLSSLTRYVLLFDGIGMKLASWLAEGRVHPDLNGTDLFPRVMRNAAARAVPLYLIGGSAEVIEATASRIERDYPAVRVAGYRSGYFTEAEEPEVCAQVRASGARLLVLARGSSLQRDFLLRNLAELGVSVVWNAGGLFNFVSGAVPRAPRAVRVLRLEWLFRLVREPRRMWHRNAIVGPWLLRVALRQRFARSRPEEVMAWKHIRPGK